MRFPTDVQISSSSQDQNLPTVHEIDQTISTINHDEKATVILIHQ